MFSLGMCAIDIVDNVKVLGVIFNQHMAWDKMVQCMCKKLSKAVNALYKYRYIINNWDLKLIYNSLFYFLNLIVAF